MSRRVSSSKPVLWSDTLVALTRMNSRAALLILPLVLTWNAVRLQAPAERLLFLTAALLSPLILLKSAGPGRPLSRREYALVDASIVLFAVVLLLVEWRVARPDAPSAAYVLLLSAPLYFMRWAVVYAHAPRLSWSLSLAYLLLVTAGISVPFVRGHPDLDPVTVLLLGTLLIYTSQDVSRATRQLEAERLQRQEAQQLSLVDALTGLPNRRAFERAARALASGATHSLILLDIDHFKRVNDDHGHDVGDQVLAALSRQLTLLSACSTAYRWGGEEFALLCPHTDLPEAASLAEDVRQLVAGSDLPLRVTVSVGVGPYRPGRHAHETFARVDAALRRAKSGGRNRVCVAGPGEPET